LKKLVDDNTISADDAELPDLGEIPEVEDSPPPDPDDEDAEPEPEEDEEEDEEDEERMTKPTMIAQEEIESGIDAHLLGLSVMERPTMEVKTIPTPRRNEVDHRRYIRLWKLASIHF
jgi:hypothetical protein